MEHLVLGHQSKIPGAQRNLHGAGVRAEREPDHEDGTRLVSEDLTYVALLEAAVGDGSPKYDDSACGRLGFHVEPAGVPAAFGTGEIVFGGDVIASTVLTFDGGAD